jgi:hypothetical protein
MGPSYGLFYGAIVADHDFVLNMILSLSLSLSLSLFLSFFFFLFLWEL